MAILTDLNDPRVQNLTVTHVDVSADLREARSTSHSWGMRRSRVCA